MGIFIRLVVIFNIVFGLYTVTLFGSIMKHTMRETLLIIGIPALIGIISLVVTLFIVWSCVRGLRFAGFLLKDRELTYMEVRDLTTAIFVVTRVMFTSTYATI